MREQAQSQVPRGAAGSRALQPYVDLRSGFQTAAEDPADNQRPFDVAFVKPLSARGSAWRC
jgi:hypothetical protein